jgi:polyhydroxyalkanoate synthesis regulator phasin
MQTNTLIQLLQQSFHIGVGATASLLETLQDPQKRAETLSEFQQQFTQQTQQWAEKGEITEQEARRMLDELLKQQKNSNKTGVQSPSSSDPSNSNIESEIEELTQQVIALRTELENLRQSN